MKIKNRFAAGATAVVLLAAIGTVATPAIASAAEGRVKAAPATIEQKVVTAGAPRTLSRTRSGRLPATDLIHVHYNPNWI